MNSVLKAELAELEKRYKFYSKVINASYGTFSIAEQNKAMNDYKNYKKLLEDKYKLPILELKQQNATIDYDTIVSEYLKLKSSDFLFGKE